ncbi:MAG: hypothetical protein ABFR65_14005 [Pseudomonadota bacterium]
MRKALVLYFAGFSLFSSGAYAGTYEAEIKTHRMTGAENVVDGANAVLVSTDAGVAGSFTTKNLNPGHIYTLWVAIMNKPKACELKDADHCTGKDVMKRAEAVSSDVTYGDGVVAAADGTATFRTFVPAGPLEYSWLGNGLMNPTGAEIHFALHDHGPMIPDKAREMLTTARGGCTDVSLPKSWPASGNAGPNKCTMAQFAISQQK